MADAVRTARRVVMLKVVKKLGGQSAKYFLEQQKSLGRVNGYIEEMINGQKVIKVFWPRGKVQGAVR